MPEIKIQICSQRPKSFSLLPSSISPTGSSWNKFFKVEDHLINVLFDIKTKLASDNFNKTLLKQKPDLFTKTEKCLPDVLPHSSQSEVQVNLKHVLQGSKSKWVCQVENFTRTKCERRRLFTKFFLCWSSSIPIAKSCRGWSEIC